MGHGSVGNGSCGNRLVVYLTPRRSFYIERGAEFNECITWDLPSCFLLYSCSSSCSLHPVFYPLSNNLNSLPLKIYGPLGQLWHPEDEDPGEVIVDLKKVAL